MIPASETFHHVIGLDLGRQTDPSALALLQWRTERRATTKPVYKLPTLKRWPLGTPYLDIARSVVKFLQTPLLAATPCWLVADATGVGSAVCEMLKEEIRVARVRAHMAQILITAGSAVTLAPGGVWHVAKKQLVSTMQVVLGQRRLESAEVPEAATLDRELRTFSVKITDSANETFESWRERDHDDLVLAVAFRPGGRSAILSSSHRRRSPSRGLRHWRLLHRLARLLARKRDGHRCPRKRRIRPAWVGWRRTPTRSMTKCPTRTVSK